MRERRREKELARKERRSSSSAAYGSCSERFQRAVERNAGIQNELFSRATQPWKRLKTNCVCR